MSISAFENGDVELSPRSLQLAGLAAAKLVDESAFVPAHVKGEINAMTGDIVRYIFGVATNRAIAVVGHTEAPVLSTQEVLQVEKGSELDRVASHFLKAISDSRPSEANHDGAIFESFPLTFPVHGLRVSVEVSRIEQQDADMAEYSVHEFTSRAA